MENSKAYKCLIQQINVTGSQRFDGYYSRIMEEIFDWERDEVEDLIWKTFNQEKDMGLAQFLPKLKKYDGLGALKKMLASSTIPSYTNVAICEVLYGCTEDGKYLDMIKQNIDMDENETSYVAILADCKPCKKAYDLLVDIYLHSNNLTNRSTAVTGILYNKGYIVNPYDMREMMEKVEFHKKFITDDADERKKIINMLETGQFEKYRQ